jgi:hypothetical protein
MWPGGGGGFNLALRKTHLAVGNNHIGRTVTVQFLVPVCFVRIRGGRYIEGEC